MTNETKALNLGGTLTFAGSIGDRGEEEEKDSVNVAFAIAVVVGGAVGGHETLGRIAE